MEISTTLSNIDYVLHLADLHFPKDVVSNEQVHGRYIAMIKNILQYAKTCRKSTIAVITGDLLHNNDQGSPDLIKTCIKFINKLADIMPVFIIAGNHDYNHATNKSWFDILDTATNDNAHFLTQSGWYIITAKFNRLLIGFQAINDNYYSFFYNNQNVNEIKKQYKCRNAIALFHGNVSGCKLSATKIHKYDESAYNKDSDNRDYNINKNWMKEYDYVMLGHIHERQKIEPNIYYAGSTIQRTFAESYINHGGIYYNLITKCNPKYINFNDPYAYVTLNEIDAKLHTDLPCGHDKTYILRIFHTNALTVTDRKEISDYYNTAYNVTNIEWSYRDTGKRSKPVTNADDFFSNSIANYSKDVQESLRKINVLPQNVSSTAGVSISLQSLLWSNVFCYGSDISKLKFGDDSDNPITVISAQNTAGKSTIWRIILVALYADIEQRTVVSKLLDNIVNKNATEGWIKLHCTINNDDVIIHRQFKVKTQRCTHVYTYTVNGTKVDKTWFKNKLIPFDTFTSNYSLTKDTDSIYSKTLGKLQKYINDTFNLDIITSTIETTQETISKQSSQLISLSAKRDATADKLNDIKSINTSDISAQIESYSNELKALIKPLNPFSHFSNVNVTSGTIIDVNIDSQEYPEIVYCYNHHTPSRNMITIYSKYNHIDLQTTLKLFDTVEQSNKVKTYIAKNDTESLSKLLDIQHDTLVDTCWNILQEYLDVIDHTIHANDQFNFNDYSEYILRSDIVLPTNILDNWTSTCLTPDYFDELAVYEIEQENLDVTPSNKYIDIIEDIYELYTSIHDTCHFDINDITQPEQSITWTTSFVNSVKKIARSSTLKRYDKELQEDLNKVSDLLNHTNYSAMTKEELINNLQKCVHTLKRLKNDKTFNEMFSKSECISMKELSNIYISCIETINEYNRYALEQNTILYNYHVNRLSKCYSYLQQVTEQNKNIVEQAKKLICCERTYKTFDTICRDIWNWCNNILYTVTESYKTYNAENEEYMKQYVTITSAISQLNNDIKHYTTDLQKYTTILNDLTCKCTQVETDIDIQKKYKLSLENTRLQIMEKGLKLLGSNINDELETYIQYHIDIDFVDTVNKPKQISVKIIHNQTNKIIPFDNLSGYEKAIIQFVTMHIINAFSSYSFNLFYIDEAFDVFDDHNFNLYISQLLQIAADYTQNVLFVTHRSLPINTCYNLRTIEQNNGVSRL